jgi:hypothetical protein
MHLPAWSGAASAAAVQQSSRCINVLLRQMWLLPSLYLRFYLALLWLWPWLESVTAVRLVRSSAQNLENTTRIIAAPTRAVPGQAEHTSTCHNFSTQ